ncbi:MAG: M17 family peptidase N-terminal domain-containing protein [Acidimicrobiales bacterium]
MTITVEASAPTAATVVAVPVASVGPVPDELGLDRTALGRAGFEGKSGQTAVIPRNDGPTYVVVGIGDASELDAAKLRDAAAAFARAAAPQAHLAAKLAEVEGVPAELFALSSSSKACSSLATGTTR